MILDVLPTRLAGAAANMATDFLLLQHYAEPERARFRHYGWHRPAFTFGFSQKLAWVQAQLSGNEPMDLCRRPTGGGLVDHRDDWTYALVIPRGHRVCDLRATESYRDVHQCLADALGELGRPAQVATDCSEPASCLTARDPHDSTDAAPHRPAPAGICFQRAERHDVIDPSTGAKIAGAAQKRTRHGLLFQGSVLRSMIAPVDSDALQHAFTAKLARLLEADDVEVRTLGVQDDELDALTEQYSSPEWNAYR